MRSLLIGLLILTSGCGAPVEPPEVTASPGQLALTLAQSVDPLFADSEAGVAFWERWVEAHPKRDAYAPENEPAARDLAQELADAGFEVEVNTYPAGAFVAEAPFGMANAQTRVVVATKTGPNPNIIALGAHYDTQSGTLYGAYDNGSGAALVARTCADMAALPLDHTLICLLFDAEELGAVSSQQFLDSLDGTIEVYLGYDMVGLNWPGKEVGDGTWKLYAWVGSEHENDLFPFVNQTFHGVLGWPASGAEVFPFNDRNSDEANFAAAGIPTVRFAGGRTAGDYPQYHLPQDSVEYVESFAGGRDKFVAGFGAVQDVSIRLVQLLDQTSVSEMAADYG